MNVATRFFVSIFAIASLAACTPSPAGTAATTADAVLQYCKALAAYDLSVATLNALGPTATVGQYKEAHKAVLASYESVVASAKDVREAKTDALKTSGENLQKSINGISDSTTMVQVVAAVQPQVQAVRDTVKQNQTDVKCG